MLETKTDSIILFPDMRLYQVCRKTSREEVEKLCLVDRIKSAMKESWVEGFGLAAIQIGIPIQAGWFKTPAGNEILLINPVINAFINPFIAVGEACLSIPNEWYTTDRYAKILLNNDNRPMGLTGHAAWIAQHEIDHMGGRLCNSRIHVDQKIGRNEPCPMCMKDNIKIKYKKCPKHYK